MLPVRPRNELLETCQRRDHLPNSVYLEFWRGTYMSLYHQHIYSKMLSKIIYIKQKERRTEKLTYEHTYGDQFAPGELAVNKYLQGHTRYISEDTSSDSLDKDFVL